MKKETTVIYNISFDEKRSDSLFISGRDESRLQDENIFLRGGGWGERWVQGVKGQETNIEDEGGSTEELTGAIENIKWGHGVFCGTR